VQVIYEYQPADPAFNPATVTLADSNIMNEVALDISLTDYPSTMVTYYMTMMATSATDPVAQTNTQSDISSVSRNAVVGVVVGVMALGALLVASVIGHRTIKRAKKEKMLTGKVTKNPVVVDVIDAPRWAAAPQSV
jgi:hypothetical protein